MGGGQAGFQTAASLRQAGFDGAVTIVSCESRMPYQRPPLSKAYIKEAASFDRLLLRPESFYETNGIELLLDQLVAAIDRAAGEVVLRTGKRLAFDHLVLATGARNRVLAVPGARLSGLHLLRTAEDAEGLRRALAGAPRLVIVGGGFIGLEVAAAARELGAEVTVLEAADRLMGRVVSPATSEFFLDAHRGMGSEIVLGAKVARIVGTDHAEAVETADGSRHPCDVVLIAAGVVPNDEVALDAGLETAAGVVVDRFMTTRDPRIFAIGDCAVFLSRHADGPVRLESVQNAVDQAKCVAARIMGADAPYDSVPWFWSDQGTYKLQMAGITSHADHVHVTGTSQEGRLVVYCFRGERLLGIETVNRPGEHMIGRKLLAQNLELARDDIERHDFDLRAHVAAHGTAKPEVEKRPRG